MKMCQSHWDKLKIAIDARGLDNLIAKNEEAVVESMERELQGTSTTADFDPLMDAWYKIMHQIMQMSPNPLSLLCIKEDGTDYCPICEAYIHRNDGAKPEDSLVTDEEFEKFWFEDLADCELTIARNLGLAPKLN